MSEHSSFLTVFPGCEDQSSLCGGLEKAYITEVLVDAAEKTMTVSAWFPLMPSPTEISALCDRLKADYGLSGVGLVPDFPQQKKASAPALVQAAPGTQAPKGDVLFGRAIKQKPIPERSNSGLVV